MRLRPRKAKREVSRRDEGGVSQTPLEVSHRHPKEKNIKKSNIKKTKYLSEIRQGREQSSLDKLQESIPEREEVMISNNPGLMY